MGYKSFCAELSWILCVSEMPLHSDLRLRRFLATLGNGLHYVAFLKSRWQYGTFGGSPGYNGLRTGSIYTIIFTFIDSNVLTKLYYFFAQF